ncbi:hypothetical protein KIW84_030863 [Lathyrus oleraceus]|uniref:Uncharacterized protein n=1 Tax=Pisum sativum TaxID=3888 RepID=A0A9D5AZJ6_PEA|nr:hypothetical protein KIW84_030863 [Pisum sativum]
MEHVKDLLDDRRDWNLEMLNRTFPQNIVDVILTEKPPNQERGVDICIWKGNHSSLFSITSAYELIRCITDKYWSSHKFWYQKNQRKHNKDYVMPYNLKNNICREVARYKESCSLLKKVTQLRKVIQMIKWTPPNEAWFTLNTNGVVKKNKEAGCRGLTQELGVEDVYHALTRNKPITMFNKNMLVNMEQKLSRDWDIRLSYGGDSVLFVGFGRGGLSPGRSLAILALELLLDTTTDGKIIFQAKFKRSNKLILTASRRKFSAFWLTPRILLRTMAMVECFGVNSDLLDPPVKKQ